MKLMDVYRRCREKGATKRELFVPKWEDARGERWFWGTLAFATAGYLMGSQASFWMLLALALIQSYFVTLNRGALRQRETLLDQYAILLDESMQQAKDVQQNAALQRLLDQVRGTAPLDPRLN